VEDRLSSIIKSISLLHDDLQTRRRLRYSVLGSAATPTSEISIATRAPSRESMKMTEIPLPVSAEPLKSSGNIISSNSPNVKDTAQPLNAHTSTAKAACRPEPIPVQRTKMLSNTLDCLARIFGSKMDIPRIPYTTTAMVTWNEPWTDPSWRSRVSIEQRVLITELWQNFRVEYAHLEYNAIAATVGTKLYGLCLAGEVEEAKSLISKFKAEVAKGEVVELSSPDDDGVKNERLVEKLKRSVKRRTWRP
jgi:hypothetical protein